MIIMPMEKVRRMRPRRGRPNTGMAMPIITAAIDRTLGSVLKYSEDQPGLDPLQVGLRGQQRLAPRGVFASHGVGGAAGSGSASVPAIAARSRSNSAMVAAKGVGAERAACARKKSSTAAVAANTNAMLAMAVRR